MDIYDEAVDQLESGELLILDFPEYSDEYDETANYNEWDDEDESGETDEEYELDICGKHLFSGECDDNCINM